MMFMLYQYIMNLIFLDEKKEYHIKDNTQKDFLNLLMNMKIQKIILNILKK